MDLWTYGPVLWTHRDPEIAGKCHSVGSCFQGKHTKKEWASLLDPQGLSYGKEYTNFVREYEPAKSVLDLASYLQLHWWKGHLWQRSDAAEKQLADKSRKINTAGTSNADVPLAEPGMYQLDITLRRGQSLAARDRGGYADAAGGYLEESQGTSDPYVKFKIGRKEVFRSKIIHKNLNPVWEEKACLLVDHLREPLYIKVFDYDFGLQDDFMGSAFLDLTQLELNRPTDVTLTLKDPHYPDHDLGIILLSVVLTPKEGEHVVRTSYCK
ncbi:hypothetical protein MJG53_007855 [Ovis ammon polii x Ovis aries]|uniref:Uncharacterized protein n=1 Tax=Ovis ammon polii x Ovis aries TaxID=2918886 RepID=A0ACB9V4B2_9CETA|nr:hypothetical protein MJG53_007855 [Ovis ammon polii x Ovis aries]